MDYNILIVNGNLLPVGLENEKNTDRIKRKSSGTYPGASFFCIEKNLMIRHPKISEI
jgi:hypothetical protein